MTYILDSRCRDGIVLISDRKVTLDFGEDFDYRDKLYGVLGHVVFGSSGSTDTYEFFRGHIMNYVRTHKKNKESITYDNLITKVSEITYTINKRHKFHYEFNFCLLVGIWYEGTPSSLHLISAYGWPRTIEKNLAIGSGEKYARVIIKKIME